MARWWRGLSLGTVLFAVALGCSGKSSSSRGSRDAGRVGVARAGQAGAAGHGGSGGRAGSSAAGGVQTAAGTSGEAAGRGGSVGGVSGIAGIAGSTPAGASSGGEAAASGSGGSAGTQVGEAGAPAGAGGEPPLKDTPEGWTCLNASYGDGQCDCGCGAVDVDCTSTVLDKCDVCNTPGSCSAGACPGRIDVMRTTSCRTSVSGWTCAPESYGDGGCDCNCGVRDPDCKDASLDECPIPWAWHCPSGKYHDGASCDCGCGAPDPDCEANDSLEVCDACNGCALGTCPGLVNPSQISRCDVPEEWSCAADEYDDGVCDCGCGTFDSDCPYFDYSACERCPEDGCAKGSCGLITGDYNSHCSYEVPSGWTCEGAAYWNGVCNCGCGAVDYDCSGDPTLGGCQTCNAPGSCSSEACPGTIDPESPTACAP